MRIIGGRYRGATLDTPTGEQTRPTLDRGRENLFNILGNVPYVRQLVDGHVVDVFAGSGALGLESYSRGAGHVTFVENNRNALSALHKNISKINAENHTTVLTTNATALPKNTNIPGDIVLLDAPYYQNLHESCLGSLYNKGWISPQTLIVLQQAPDEPIHIPPWASVIKDKTYGKATRFILLSIHE